MTEFIELSPDLRWLALMIMFATITPCIAVFVMLTIKVFGAYEYFSEKVLEIYEYFSEKFR